ncbi:hypothetical protein NECAME_03030 [Necator americanus]|uniref:Uncharacterized protein n=1 Tax=Necator americanus TaxID=51031 RepID=W2T7M4_NECAM|nr:hypothetical protein NECAME_03030 [Necator americanus]ETN77858.1 hypothetical protein NECAME_03030 [Necator americanus]
MHRFPHEGQPDALFIRRGSDQPLSPDVCRNESQADRSGYYTNRQLRFGNQESHRKSDENTMLCGHPAARYAIFRFGMPTVVYDPEVAKNPKECHRLL